MIYDGLGIYSLGVNRRPSSRAHRAYAKEALLSKEDQGCMRGFDALCKSFAFLFGSLEQAGSVRGCGFYYDFLLF